MTRTDTCATCRFHDTDSQPLQAFRKNWRACRVDAPVMDHDRQYGMARGVFPYMPDDGWCGRHESSEEPHRTLEQIIREGIPLMSKAMDDLKAAITRNGTVIEGALTLIKELVSKASASSDPEMVAMAADLSAETEALAAAVLANTAAAKVEPSTEAPAPAEDKPADPPADPAPV